MKSSLELNELNDFIQNYSPGILRLAYAYLKNRSDAEDIAQEVLVSYFLKAPVFADENQRKAWLVKVTGNKCRDFLKSAWKRHVERMPEELAVLPDEERGLIEYVLLLDEKYRIPIHLFYYEGYSIAEIAKIMGSNTATVGSWLARGRKLLKTRIGVDLVE